MADSNKERVDPRYRTAQLATREKDGDRKAYTVIVDSFAFIDPDTNVPEAVGRGETVWLSDNEAKRALSPDTHPPTGAVAEKDSLLAQALSAPVPATANPDVARAQIAAIVQIAHGGGSGLFDPAMQPADKARAVVDPGVALSKTLAGQAPGPGHDIAGQVDYSKLSDRDLATIARGRGVTFDDDVSHEALVALVENAPPQSGVGSYIPRSEAARDDVYHDDDDTQPPASETSGGDKPSSSSRSRSRSSSKRSGAKRGSVSKTSADSSTSADTASE